MCEKNNNRKEYLKKWRLENSERLKKEDNERSKIWYENNKEKAKKNHSEYYLKNCEIIKKEGKNYRENNKDKIKEYQKIYRENNKDKRIIYQNERRKNDPLFKLTGNIRSGLNQAFRLKGYSKKSKTNEIIGLSFEDFKIYIESKFLPWMNWSNYGKYNGTEDFGWDIDHKVPLSSAKTEEELINLCHYTNLQPLCSYTNRDIKKHNFNF